MSNFSTCIQHPPVNRSFFLGIVMHLISPETLTAALASLCSAQWSINHFSNWMLVDTSSSLSHCVLSLLPHLIPYRRRCGLNNVIKLPHSLWPPPLPCCALTLSFHHPERWTARLLNHKATSIRRPAVFYTLFWTNPLWRKKKKRKVSLYALKGS